MGRRSSTRCLAVSPDRESFLVGSIEGRVACQHLRTEDAAKNFAFRAHRDPANHDIFPVNSIAFHPTHGTFASNASPIPRISRTRVIARPVRYSSDASVKLNTAAR